MEFKTVHSIDFSLLINVLDRSIHCLVNVISRVISACISLIANAGKHLSMCLFLICVPPFMKFLLISLYDSLISVPLSYVLEVNLHVIWRLAFC